MPLYSDVLKNTNSNAPCLNVNDLQVKGFGIFADTAARDALNETIRTEGYMASMKDDDKLYVYASSDSGDTAWQDAANWVAIGSGGGGSFKAVLSVGDTSIFSELVKIIGFDSASGLPLVVGSNANAGYEQAPSSICGIVNDAAVAGDTVTVIVSGEISDFRFGVPIGDTPAPGSILYGGYSSNPHIGPRGDEVYSIGRLLGDLTFVQSYPGFFDAYKGRVYVSIPELNATYKDTIPYNESQRFTAFTNGTVQSGDIVAYFSHPSSLRVARWDSNTHTVDQIAGVVTAGDSGLQSICTSGTVLFDPSVVGGTTPVTGDTIYADATNSYQLTTNSTSGVKIGIVQHIETGILRINLKFI